MYFNVSKNISPNKTELLTFFIIFLIPNILDSISFLEFFFLIILILDKLLINLSISDESLKLSTTERDIASGL